MSISESIISIFEKLSTQKIAAPAALASFILLLPTFIWILLLKSEQIFRARSSSTFSELTSKLTSIFATHTPPELSRTATILSVIFVTSLSFLIINFVRDVKDALKQLYTEAGKSLKKVIIHDKRKLAQAKNLKYTFNILIDDSINIIRQFDHKINLVEIDNDKLIISSDLLEKYKLIEIASEAKNNKKYIRLNPKYEFFIRIFVDGDLDEWIFKEENRVNSLKYLLVFHSVFFGLFDPIYYTLVAITFVFIAMYFVFVAMYFVAFMFSIVF